ncbi:hypothetical protein ABIE56_003471 [Luteibacter sp. 621]|uniref:hypothetical protein n=1 Tax=Luteibacter sp. 621 TaxID=3373916 RepID=UPI003D1C2A1D
MNRDSSTELMFALATKVGQRATAIGASLASLVGWALVAGYIYNLSYFSNVGARWIVGALTTTDIVAAGTTCILVVLFTVAIAVLLRASIQHSDAIWSWMLRAAWLVPATIGISAAVFHTSWMPTLSAIVSLLCVTLSTSGVLARVFYTGGTETFTPGQKVVAVLAVPIFLVMFPWFVGFNTSKLDFLLETTTFPKIELHSDEDRLQWRLVRSVGDKLVVTSTLADGSRAFKVIVATDARLIHDLSSRATSTAH